MNSTKYDLEIAIPVLNEEKDLEKQINKIIKYINKEIPKTKIGIVIADNGSTDKTSEISNKLSKLNDIRTIRTNKKGVGKALKKAWLSSSAKYLGYMDLDTATDLKHLIEISDIMKINKYQIITGSRNLPGSKVKNRKLHRGLLSKGFNLIIKLMFSSKITDGMIGFKFIQKNTLQSLIENGAKSDGWIFGTEILLVAEYLNLEIKQIAVNWKDDQNSKVKIFNLIIEYLKALIKLRFSFLLAKF